jgi:regulator of protease activity HflC (stomatin/prohibitin superfamily)
MFKRVFTQIPKQNMINTFGHINHPRKNFITVVRQAEVAYREFLGSNRVKLEPGIHLNMPIIHSINRVDLRETGINVKELYGYTKDNVPVKISANIFFIILYNLYDLLWSTSRP